jgi:hypothetical protein
MGRYPRQFNGCALLLTGLMVFLAVPHAGAEVILLRSGNGTVGGTDSLVNMLVGPANSPFGAAFTPADFTAARTGPAAHIINNHAAWIAGLAGDPNSKWIGTNPGAVSEGATALYAIDFALTQPVLSATLDLHYSVDNLLGGGPNQGVFLNGTAISGSSTGGSFGSEFTLFRGDIGPLLSVGTNTLYINASDVGGPGGLLFRAEINTVPVPEPSTLALFLLAIGSISGYGYYRRKRTA